MECVEESVIEVPQWKQRWAVLDKLSPVADVLQLQLYRDSRDRAKGASTKASLALQNVLALETECNPLVGPALHVLQD
ncbi:hypothetical protein Pcinc_005443 [Petrolisthes cinctipes]|uniref:Uncharacterized protein n=1 Tax=Petrolisthes cinctipes TaxID=88211 RepID=A0AAE1GDC0_PETCI|nr:hypothetical protein Pcinc_005443 [Petrolisthes cinctipes]